MAIRTDRQNRALHLLFTHLADELNSAGYDMRRTLKESIDIPWTKESIKEYMWKPVMKIQLGKKSTTDLTTQEIDEVFETINRYLGEKFGIHVQFPSINSFLEEHDLQS